MYQNKILFILSFLILDNIYEISFIITIIKSKTKKLVYKNSYNHIAVLYLT